MKLTILLIILCSLLVIDKQFKEPYYSERDSLAALINSECGNCDLMEMYLCGSVVINRMHDPRFPNSVREVIREYGQFHGYKSNNYRPTPKTRKIADDLLAGRYLIPCLIYFCTHESKKPMTTVTVIGEKHIYGQ